VLVAFKLSFFLFLNSLHSYSIPSILPPSRIHFYHQLPIPDFSCVSFSIRPSPSFQLPGAPHPFSPSSCPTLFIPSNHPHLYPLLQFCSFLLSCYLHRSYLLLLTLPHSVSFFLLYPPSSAFNRNYAGIAHQTPIHM
jgi:hypothetical protein